MTSSTYHFVAASERFLTEEEPLEEVLRARAWSYTVLSMASGAEESMGLELQLRDGSLRRYAGFRLFEVVPALVAAGKLAPEPENGGNSGGIGRPLMLFGWMLLVGAVILSTWRGTG